MCEIFTITVAGLPNITTSSVLLSPHRLEIHVPYARPGNQDTVAEWIAEHAPEIAEYLLRGGGV